MVGTSESESSLEDEERSGSSRSPTFVSPVVADLLSSVTLESGLSTFSEPPRCTGEEGLFNSSPPVESAGPTSAPFATVSLPLVVGGGLLSPVVVSDTEGATDVGASLFTSDT